MSPTLSSASLWRTSGPRLASPLSTAPSSRGDYSCIPGIPLIPPKDFVPAAAARSPAAGLRSSLLGTTGIFTPVPTLQLSDPAFYDWQMFSSFATTPTAAPLRRPVPWPAPHPSVGVPSPSLGPCPLLRPHSDGRFHGPALACGPTLLGPLSRSLSSASQRGALKKRVGLTFTKH
ncbi:hypothetical protein NQZ68_004656 [Dissostichus eleginoides]|nr:hypothetical protein NQZ68_004656 [Dissostichus eleginoides]